MSAASAKPKALILLPEAPYPAIGGGPLRTASIVGFLAASYELHAIHFRLAGDPDPADAYPAGYLKASHSLELPQHAKALWPKMKRNLRRGLQGVPPLVDRFSGFDARIANIVGEQEFDLIWIEHFWAAPYGALLRRHTRKLVLDLHNVESQYFASLGADAALLPRLLWGHFSECALALEGKLIPTFDLVVTTSHDDRNRIAKLASASAVVPNTIPLQEMPQIEKTESIVFSGNFAYQPNQQALEWFLAKCWPDIRRALPQCRLRLVGKEIEYARRMATNQQGIDFVGPVEDAVVAIASSRVAIVPLLAGSGTRLKILEAWAAGTAVVSTSIGAEGLNAVPDLQIKIANGATAFSQSVVDLFDNKEVRFRLAQAARQFYEASYTWQAAHKTLSELDL